MHKRSALRVIAASAIAALVLGIAAGVAHARRDTDWPCPGCRAPHFGFR